MAKAAPSAASDSAKIQRLAAGAALEAHLQQGPLAPIYLVTSGDGAEAPSRQEEPPSADPLALRAAAAVIETAALQGGDPALDLVRIDYLDGDHIGNGVHALIANEARSMSLFGGRRVVSVIHCEGIDFDGGGAGRKRVKADATMDPIERLIEGLPTTGPAPFVLILSASRFDRRKRAFTALASRGVVVEVAPMDAPALHAYLEQEAQPLGIRVDRGVAQKIWDRLGGGEPARLRQTADRLLLDVGPGGSLTVARVEDVVPMDRDAAVWAITDAIAAGDVTRGLTVLHMLVEHGQEPIAIGAAITGNLRTLLQVAAAVAEGGDENSIAANLGWHPYRVKLALGQVRRMRPGQLERAQQTVAHLDFMLRATALGDGKAAATRWVEAAILALCQGTPLRAAGRGSLVSRL